MSNKKNNIFLNYLYQKNPWYNRHFGDCIKIEKQIKSNLDVVNTGSNSAFYAFDYSDANIRAANLALRPQSLNQDLNMLKMFKDFIRPGGIVLVPLGPFSSCLKIYKSSELERYYTIWHPSLIENYDEEKCKSLQSMRLNPLKGHSIRMFKGYIRFLLNKIARIKKPESFDSQPMNQIQLEQDANKWINIWKNQFNILDLEQPLSNHIIEGRKKRVETLKEIVSFCRERNFNLVFVIPPVTKHLSNKLSIFFRELYIYSFLKESGAENVPMLDYLDNEEYQKDELFFNSFFLNRKGRNVFTKRVLEDLRSLLENKQI